MSETMSRGACQRDKRGDLPKIREKRCPERNMGKFPSPPRSVMTSFSYWADYYYYGSVVITADHMPYSKKC